MKKEKKVRKKMKIFETSTILLLIATLFMSVVFANVTDIQLNISGTLNALVQDGVFITDASLLSTNGAVSEEIKYFRKTALSTSIELSKTSTSSVIYAISLYNNSSTDYYFTGISYVEEGYDNSKITYDLEATSDSYITLEPYTTIISPREEINANITFKYAEGVTVSTSQILNSLLNFDFSNEFIEFKIGTETYTAPKGANWEQYINSEYNTIGLNINGEKVYTVENKELLYTDEANNIIGEEVKITDVISEDYIYVQKPEITLDKETLELTLSSGTVVDTLTATVDNKDLELKWEVEPTDSGITLSGTGNTRTITATKAIEEAVITVSYGVAKATCTVTVTAKELPQIGDKVVYNEGTGLISGVDNTFSMKDMEWRVLDVEDDGTIELISTQPTSSALTLSGESGYLYGPDNLDKLCNDLYGQGIGASSARSLKVDDIDKLAGIETDADKQELETNYGSRWQYRYSTSEGSLQYRTSTDGTIWGNWTNIEGLGVYQTFKEPGEEIISSSNTSRIADLTHTRYIYTISDYVKIETFDGISMASLVSQGLNNSNNEASGSFFTQYLSSRGYCEYNSHHGGFFIRRIAVDSSTGVGKMAYADLCGTTGESYSCGGLIRPVVILRPDIVISKNDGEWTVHESSRDYITFKINGIEYTAKEGMTWDEWISSSYNTAYAYNVDYVCVDISGGTYYIRNDYNPVFSGYTIVEGYDYTISEYNS